MATRNTYETGFDEDTGRTITASECPECGGALATDGGETKCTECGLIVNTYRLAHGAGPRQFDDEDEARTGDPLTVARHDRGLSTKIGRAVDGRGHTLSQKKQRRLGRQRRYHERAKFDSKADRNLARGCCEIARIVGALDLSYSLRMQASALFRQAQDEGLLPGRSIEAMAAGSVYAACRCSGTVRTFEDIARVMAISRERIENGYRVLNRELGLPVPPRQPREFVSSIASEADVSRAVERRAVALAERAQETGVSVGKHPAGFAAACLRAAAGEEAIRLSQSTVAEAADVSPATVRAHRECVEELQMDG